MSVETTTRTVEQRHETYTCDVCGGDAGDRGVERVRVFAQRGRDFGDDGCDVSREAFDYCHACWAAKVLPALMAIGAGPRKEERCA